MSDEIDIFEDDNEVDLPKKLRAKIKELQKANDELTQQFTEIAAERRKQSLSENLAQRGLNPKIAAFVPADVEGESLDEWLNEYGDVFGGGQSAAVPNPQQAEINRMNALQAQGTQAPPADIMARIDQAENMEELMAALGQHS